MYSVCAFFSIYFYEAEKHLHLFATYYEGFAMTALFLLYVFLVCPNVTDRAQYFTNLDRKLFNGRAKRNSHGSLRWFRVRASHGQMFMGLILLDCLDFRFPGNFHSTGYLYCARGVIRSHLPFGKDSHFQQYYHPSRSRHIHFAHSLWHNHLRTANGSTSNK